MYVLHYRSRPEKIMVLNPSVPSINSIRYGDKYELNIDDRGTRFAVFLIIRHRNGGSSLINNRVPADQGQEPVFPDR